MSEIITELKGGRLYGVRLGLVPDAPPEKLLSFCLGFAQDLSLEDALNKHFEHYSMDPGEYKYVIEVKDFGEYPGDRADGEGNVTQELIDSLEAISGLYETLRDSDPSFKDRIMAEFGLTAGDFNLPVGSEFRESTSDMSLVKTGNGIWTTGDGKHSLRLADEVLVTAVDSIPDFQRVK